MSETEVVNYSDTTVKTKNLKYITLTFCYVFITFFFLVNGNAIFPQWGANESSSMFLYLTGVVAFLTVALMVKDMPFSNKKLTSIISSFCFSFPIFWMIFIIIKDSGLWFQGIIPMPMYLIVPTIIYQIFIVAASEEIMFRGTIFPLLAKINIILSFTVTSALFGLFHYASYSASTYSIMIAMGMGCLLTLLFIKFNIGSAIAFHACYNLIVVGALII